MCWVLLPSIYKIEGSPSAEWMSDMVWVLQKTEAHATQC